MTSDARVRLVARHAGHNLVALTVPARPEAVPHTRSLLVAFAALHGASPALCSDVALAVSEAVTNAVKHGYQGMTPGPVHVVADLEDGAVEVVVADEGRGLSSEVESDGLGLGLGLIARSASRFAARDRTGGGSEIWMRFVL